MFSNMENLRPVLGRIAIAATACFIAVGSAQADDMTSCDGKKFVFFPGGPEGGAFASIVYNGARLAQEHTGCDVEYVWSDWSSEKIVRQFSEAIARNPSGIAVMGHPGEVALAPLVKKAREKGIIVTTQNVGLPEDEKTHKASGFGYVGANNYSAGLNLARGLVAQCGLKEGSTALVWGLLAQEARGERSRGAIEGLKEAGINVEYLEISDAVNKDPIQGIPVLTATLASNTSISAVIADHGGLTGTLPTMMKAAGKAPGDVCGGGFDLSAATVEGIRSGHINAVLDQQPFLQGYLPIVQLYLSSQFGFAGMNIDTGAAIITADNVEAVSALAKEAIR
jgi:simple sugar transport system substrate-binding protein